jgi:hypothetical protein
MHNTQGSMDRQKSIEKKIVFHEIYMHTVNTQRDKQSEQAICPTSQYLWASGDEQEAIEWKRREGIRFRGICVCEWV